MYLLAVLSVVGAAFFSCMPQASAYDCPAGRECHFVRIDQTKRMRWNASMAMYEVSTGNKIYTWEEKHGLDGSSPKSGAYALWWWNVDPDDPDVRIELTITYKEDAYVDYPYKNCIGNIYCGGEYYVTEKEVTEKIYPDTAKGDPATLDPMANHCFVLSPTGGLSSVAATGKECPKP